MHCFTSTKGPSTKDVSGQHVAAVQRRPLCLKSESLLVPARNVLQSLDETSLAVTYQGPLDSISPGCRRNTAQGGMEDLQAGSIPRCLHEMGLSGRSGKGIGKGTSNKS